MSESADPGWPARLRFRQLPDDPGALELEVHDLNRRQLPGPGWNAILEDLHEQLVALDPEYVLTEVKEKFGTLRVTAVVAPDVGARARELTTAAEWRSIDTCEGCGAPGRLRDERRWALTLCDSCDAREPEGRPLPNEWEQPPG